MPPLLERLGLRSREQRAWASYDWAVSAMQTTIMAAVFPIYFVKVASADIGADRGSQQLAYANTVALVLVTVLSPVLGALADHSAAKKRFLLAFAVLGAVPCALMFFIERGDVGLAKVLYALAMVGAQGSMAFYGALLPHIARDEEVDRVSTAGYAIGYVGGGLLLAAQLLWIAKPALFGMPNGTLPARLALASVGAWWLLFTIPILRGVPEPPPTREPGEGGDVWIAPFVRLGHTIRELRGFRQAALLLVAFMIYNDGISTIIKMATAYGTSLGIGEQSLIAAILIVQFVGIPCSFAFGALAKWVGAKRAVVGGLLVYCLIAVLGYYMRTATHFLVLALLVGLVQGGTQALSRSLFASMVPPHRSGEFFGFYGVFEKFSGLFGPLLFALVIQLGGTSRQGILSVVVFFVVGTLLLSRVDVDEGKAYAQEAERAARSAEREAQITARTA